MTAYERRLFKDIETLLAEQERDLAKSMSAARRLGRSRRRRPDFGRVGARPASTAGIDLVKAETQLRAVDRAGLLTKAQSNEAWRRLNSLRPVQIIPLG